MMVTIRKAMDEDIDSITSLWEELMLFHARLDPIFSPSPSGKEHYGLWLERNLHQDDSIVLVAEDDNEIVGFVLAHYRHLPPVILHRDIGFISDMAMAEGYRNQGIGRKLYNRAEELLRRMGATRIELKTSSRNPLSNHFWEEVCGFKEFVKYRYKDLDDGTPNASDEN